MLSRKNLDLSDKQGAGRPRGGGIQRRRAIGRRYVFLYGWFTLAATCALLVLGVKRYFTGMLAGNMALRYIAGLVAGFIISGILILVVKSK